MFPDDRYEIATFVSQGNMGDVYRGTDKKLSRSVALKKIRKSMSGNALQGALQEGRAQAVLNHPNIVQVYDVVTTASDIWLVSEWVEGITLDKPSVPQHPLAVCAILIQILNALAKMHKQNILHRDIKPSNIMLTDEGRVVVIDFGVAFTPWGSSGETMVGTLRYTDPKILEGARADVLSDMHSLAILTLELLLGKQMLPELAPLPLHQYLKRQFATDLSIATEGMFPPLRCFIHQYCQQEKKSDQLNLVNLAETEAQKLTDLLLQFSFFQPAALLREYLKEPTSISTRIDKNLGEHCQKMIRSQDLSLNEKTFWLSYAAKICPEGSLVVVEKKRPPFRKQLWPLAAILLCLSIAGSAFWFFKSEKVTTRVRVSVIPEPQLIAAPPPAKPMQVKVKPQAAPAAPKNLGLDVTIIANAWADVFIDGVKVGRLPRAQPFTLKSGSHTLKLVNPAMAPYEEKITITNSTPKVLRVSLQANPKEASDAKSL